MEYDIVKNKWATRYYKKGTSILHREDGPAIEWSHGSKEWYINGYRHREAGSAVERWNGDKWWYINRLLHREDGPAIERGDGYKEWWVMGKRLSPEKEALMNVWWDNKNGI